MYNTDMPTRAELPSTRQLLRSTALAAATAAALLVTVVLPAEYAIDPTGIGRALGLTPMGEIKGQLSREAEADRARDQPAPLDRRSSLFGTLFANLVIGQAQAQPAPKADEMSLTLAPGEGVEVKMQMNKGATATYAWAAEGGALNYDMHGTMAGSAKETSYKKGRAAAADEGVLTAGYEGHHGWFWRNRGSAPTTVKLKVSGAYTDLKRMK